LYTVQNICAALRRLTFRCFASGCCIFGLACKDRLRHMRGTLAPSYQHRVANTSKLHLGSSTKRVPKTSTIAWLLRVGCLAVAAALAACAAPAVDAPLATGSVKAGATAETAGGTEQRKPAGNERVAKVALLLPMSAGGQTAAIAKGMKQAGELALFDAGGATVQLIVKDDLGTPEGAAAAADSAVKEGAEIIIGPLFAASVKAVAPVASRANVPVVAFSNDAQVAGRGVYLMSFLVTQDVNRIVAYSIGQGRKRFAALLPDDSYGRMIGESFRQAVATNGGTIKGVELYPAQANGMLEPARRLVEAIKAADEDGEPVEALFVPGGADTLSTLGPLISYAGMDTTRVKLIGTGAWDYPGIGREASFVGGWFPAPEPRGWQEFSERFGKTFGTAPPRIATLAYDAVTVAVQLSANAPGARFTAANLTRNAGFNGADGPVRLRADGTAERGLAILEVQKLGANLRDPAPASLVPAKVSANPGQPVN
jgi:branched-chain amino acid transport system substrate-binding protein